MPMTSLRKKLFWLVKTGISGLFIILNFEHYFLSIKTCFFSNWEKFVDKIGENKIGYLMVDVTC